MADFFILKAIQFNQQQALKKRGLQPGGAVQKYIDSKVLEYCAPMVPKDVAAASQGGNLIESGKIHTVIGTGEVKYHTPYARRWYYMPANFQQAPERGNYWFERMKQKHKQHILNGAQKIANGEQ